MKKSLLGSFVGICIVLSIDSLSRVIIALYKSQEIPMFSYSEFPGLLWPVLLTGIAAFSTFFGAMFAFTYGRAKQVFTLVSFLILVGIVRYGQILLLKDTEGIFYPVTALILSLICIVMAWRLVRPAKTQSKKQDFDAVNQTHRHHPVEDDGQDNQPQ